MEIILIKYGDLVLKKNNRKFFIKTLKENIKRNLTNIDYEIKEDLTRMFITTNEIDKVIDILKNIYGIYEIDKVLEVETRDINVITDEVIKYLDTRKFTTFKVNCKRSDKSYPIISTEMNNIIGSSILKHFKDKKVDVHNPEIEVIVEVRNKYAYIYKEKIEGLKGYPVSTLGKGLLMLSGGIDSPVAAYLTIKKGVKLDYIYFESLPHTSIEARNKVISLAKKLEKYNIDGKIYVIPFTKIQEAIYKNLKLEYLITIMRRMMYRIATLIAKENNYLAIFNGESIGQVASQTLTSIKCVNDVTSFPIIRPLASFDKEEIIKISKKIGTYDISILPYEDCCTVFVPDHPVINPNLNIIYSEEEKIDYEVLIEEAIQNMLIVDLNKENDTVSEYL